MGGVSMCRLVSIKIILTLSTFASSLVHGAADTGSASGSMLNHSQSMKTLAENSEQLYRVRIPVTMQAWNAVTSKGVLGDSKSAKIAARPLNHVLRARLEKANDFYLGDWRIQTTPIRWLKNTSQYQLKLDVFRRFGEGGQVEESLGSLNLSGVLKKQADGIHIIYGSSKHRFLDNQGQPLLDIAVGTPVNNLNKATAVSQSAGPAKYK